MAHSGDEKIVRAADEPAEEILEPALPIVDSHHHLRDRPGAYYMLPDYLEDIQTGHNVRATVAVETSAFYRATGPVELRPVGETEFLNGVAAMAASGRYGPALVCAGIVGYADLKLGNRVKPVLEAHIAAGGGRFRGIRNPATWHTDKDFRHSRVEVPQNLLLDRAFRDGTVCLGKLGLSLDIWIFHTQISELLDLAKAVPETKFMLNHIGGPLGAGQYAGRREEIFKVWKAGMRLLADCPNIYVKLGGMGMPVLGFGFNGRDRRPSSLELADAWRPYFETCIELFGTNRCMFESNFPPDKVSFGYSIFWNACKRFAAHYSAAEKAALFSNTAARAYRLMLD